MSEPEAVVSQRRRISAVWIVPAVAMLLGIWLVVNAYLERGPVVEIRFATAEGLEENVTTVRVREVEIGVVSEISLNENLSGVTVMAELGADARRLLREDTQFWVVRPRVSTSGISGLGTIVSGAYIELAPGTGEPAEGHLFDGLEQPPLTPARTPGLRVTLVSQTSGSVGVGDPVLYRGFPVGRIEDSRLDVEAQELRYLAFIEAPYDDLVTSSTRFWNASGISVEITPEGARVSLGSLESLIVGGVAFDSAATARRDEPVQSDQSFVLHPDESSIVENPHRYAQEYVVLFSQSVRGLDPGAPVTFRGIPVGSVRRLMVGEGTASALDSGEDTAIPVLIHIEPGRLELGDSPEGLMLLRRLLARAVDNGVRATLESGNLLTGSLYVNLDYFDSATERSTGEFEGYPTIPSVSTGLGLLQQQVSELLSRLNNLPLDQTLVSANATLDGLHGVAEELDTLLESEAIRRLPTRLDDSLAQLDRTLSAYSADSDIPEQLSRAVAELNRTLESVRTLADRLERNPNALLFPSRYAEDPQPEAGSR